MIEGSDILSRHFPGQDARYFPAVRIGMRKRDRNMGAELILSGKKYATSSLPWEWNSGIRPFVGALSVLYDGEDIPRAILETNEVFNCPLNEVRADFVRAYGEGDGTVEGFIRETGAYYARLSAEAGEEFTPESPLICEYFKVIRILRTEPPTFSTKRTRG